MANDRTDIGELIQSLDGGTFEARVSAALTEVAQGVVRNSKKGKLVIELDMAQIGNSSQVEVAHTLKYSAPTKTGKHGEESKTKTPLYVTQKGKLVLFPENQTDMFKSKEEAE